MAKRTRPMTKVGSHPEPIGLGYTVTYRFTGDQENKSEHRNSLIEALAFINRIEAISVFEYLDIHSDSNEIKDMWSENIDYRRTDWQIEVANGDTNLGYWDWVEHRKECDKESEVER